MGPQAPRSVNGRRGTLLVVSTAVLDGAALQVFLGYSHADHSVAAEIRDGLKACGLHVWSDEDIHPGQSLSATIASAIDLADAFVMLLSRTSSRSQWAALEVGGAIASNKRLIPVLVERDAEVPFMLRDRKFIDAADPTIRADAIGKICSAIREPTEPHTDVREGAELTRLALRNLERERDVYDSRMALVRRSYVWRLVLGWIAILGAVASGATALIGGSNVASAGVAAGVTLLTATIGFRYAAHRLLYGTNRMQERHGRVD